jgi:hypothetical protein
LSDTRRFASVLPDRDFVQMPGVAQNKFKLSVARALHLPAGRPKLEHVAGFLRQSDRSRPAFAVDLG